MRLSAVFIAVCMVVIAGSLGAAAYLTLGLSPAAAGGTAFGVLSLLAAFHAFTTRLSGQAQLAHQLAELSRGTTELAHQVGELGRRVVAAEAALAQGLEQARAAADPLAAELDLLGTLVTDLAESVAAHDARLGARAPAAPAALIVPAAPVAAPAPVAMAQAAAPEAAGRDEMLATPATPKADATPLRELAAAVADNRIELYLQPVVTLPQRKVRHYQATARLRLEDGVLLAHAEYRAAAEAIGLLALIDHQLLLRATQVARRLAGKSRDVAVLCEITAATLADATAFAQVHEFLSANRPLTPSLVLGLPQATLRTIGPIELEGLAQIASLGFHFVLTDIADLRLDGRQLAAQGFRFVKTPAAVLLDRTAAAADIHPSDLSSLLGRFGIELIVDAVDTEGTVVDLLDYDVGFAQGVLFGPPRAVRVDLFEGAAAPAARAPAGAAPPIAIREADPNRRRDADPAAPTRPAGERNPHGLVSLARNMMRRA